jgi:phosphatidate cytidylyltransferase
VKQRVVTALLLIPPVLLAVFLSSPWPLAILALAAFCIGYSELRRLAGLKRITVPILAFVAPAVALAPIPEHTPSRVIDSTVAAVFVFLSAVGAIGAFEIARGRRGYIVADFAALWISAPLLALVSLKIGSPAVWSGKAFDWPTSILLALVPLWIGDTLAIFGGKAFGKHLLAPKISPKKTVEGAVFNLAGCVGGAIGVAELIGQPMLVGVLAGLATGTLGQLGDLLESAMKRSAGVKDSGTLLPGHGGLLDRIDSILLSAPVVALVVVTLGRGQVL